MVHTNTMVFRVTLGDNMCLCAVAFGPLAMLLALAVTLNSDKLNPWPQRHMLFPLVNLKPMVLEGTMLGSLHLRWGFTVLAQLSRFLLALLPGAG